MWRIVLGWAVGLLGVGVGLASLVLAIAEYRAPGLTRALLSYVVRRALRRGPKPAEYPPDAHEPGAPHFCPHGCDADAALPEAIYRNERRPYRELSKFRRVIRTKCTHLNEFGLTVHCHDVRDLHWWERNWIVFAVLAVIRWNLSASSCPEYVRGQLAEHLRPVPGQFTYNVYFVNGIYTNKKSASRQVQYLHDFLGYGYDVRLVHNRIDARLDPIQLDHDYDWGIRNSAATTPFRSMPALAAYALLLDAKVRGAEVALVGFSGGGLQIAMAIRAMRSNPSSRLFLSENVRFLSTGNLVHRSSHIPFRMSLKAFDPHVDRQDPFARAFTGDTYTFDDGRTVDLGVPEWREEVNVAIWAKVSTELLDHEEVARYHSVENNYFRTEPWTPPGSDVPRAVRHEVRDILDSPTPAATAEVEQAYAAAAAKASKAAAQSRKGTAASGKAAAATKKRAPAKDARPQRTAKPK